MDFKDTLTRFVRPAARPQDQGLQAAVEVGRQAKLAEQYDQALHDFDHAQTMAQAALDLRADVTIAVHKSEVLMRLRRFSEADDLLQSALKAAQTDAQRSYLNSMVGKVKQERGDWAGARAAYELAQAQARQDAHAGAEGRALGHLGDTYLHEGNASYAAHLLHDALVKLTSAEDTELICYFTGLHGLALIQNGQESEGQHLLDRALRLAEQSKYRLYERYWALILGDRALDEGRAQDAHAYYNVVLRLFAPETVSAEYVIAVTHMSKAASSLRRSEEALAYAQIAQKTAEKLGDPARIRQAEGALGVALRGVGRSEEAIPYLQRSADGDAQSDVLRSLAAAQVDSGDTEGAIQTYGRAIQQAESAGRTLEGAQARRDLGLVYQKRGDYQSAINAWAAALTVYDEHHAYAQIARLYCDIGSARKMLGYRQRAMRDYEQSLMVLNSLNGSDQETRGLVLSNAANAYAEQGDAESADAFFTEAISIAEHLGDRTAESTRNGNYGWFLLMVGRPRRALATLERALAISQAHHLTLQTVIQLDNLGLVYDALADYPAALEKHRSALALASDLPEWTDRIKVNLANTLITLNQLEEAQALIDAAYEQAARAAVPGEVLIMALTARARLLIAQQHADQADEALTEAINLARKLDHKRLLAEALSVRSQQQSVLEHTGEAAAAWEEAQKLYALLHMAQAKYQPAWLARSPSRT
ncbi:MAG TPA: tetratricopeptide repeat protein [Phototrophicaceae bacterium]|nr:tetratricopeptide repeat protein [Phototrophicaceae bacterium]